jgi:hypothetical protein
MTLPRISPTVAFGSLRRGAALAVASLLLSGEVLVGIGGLIGVARAYDRSVLGVASGAVWMVLLPAVLALLLAGWKPALSVAVSAGAGVVALARVLSDLDLLTSTNTVIRPEFFYEVTDRAQPFSAAPGAVVVVIGDLIMLTAGVLAARRLSNGLSFRTERIFDAAPLESEQYRSGPGLLAEALESADADRGADPGGDKAEEAAGGTERNNWLIFAGFVGVLGILIASLGLPYESGYLVNRYLPAEIDLLGIAAALVVALVGTVAVLAAAVLPRQIAVAMLGGVAIGGAVPFLTAVAVRAAGAPVRLNPIVGFGLLGALLLVAAGLLTSVRLVQDVDREPSPQSVRLLNIVGAVLTLLVAAAAFAAWRSPQLSFNGGPVPAPVSSGEISAPQAGPFLVTAIIPLIGGVLWLVPGLRRAGRAVASVGWIALVFAVAQSLYILGQLVNSASVPNAGFAAPRWTAGPGLWLGVVGIALGAAVLAVSSAASRQAVDSSALVADDETLARARSVGGMVATVMTVVTVVALVLPVYRSAQSTSATLLVGYQVNSWGVLALAIGAIAAAWMAGHANSVSAALAFSLTGAALLTTRLVIPDAVRAQDGFVVQAGLIAGYTAVAAFVVGAGVVAFSSSRIRMIDPAPLGRKVPGKKPASGKPAAPGSRRG